MSDPAPRQPDRRPTAGSRRAPGRPEQEPATVASATNLPNSSAEEREVAGQAGIDTRRRGWFWHWNTVVTQYAPLIGLKGVGLLNSYTVWTDRREESPHRGYAFPSQQSEADFYGEDRAELITINKILVALDLIEIRKEMILRTDERGRRWRVPHNLYRVKDREDGVNLRASDVMRVAKLATKDPAVYRYTRRVFSPRFEPIDRDSVWHTILVEVADDPIWRSLRERTREIEERASARTRAGHRQRARTTVADQESGAILTIGQKEAMPLPDGELPSIGDQPAPTSVAPANDGLRVGVATFVDVANKGLVDGVDPGNDGPALATPTTAAHSNTGSATAVAPTNTTYDQDQITTTTTTTRRARAGATRLTTPVPSTPPNSREISSDTAPDRRALAEAEEDHSNDGPTTDLVERDGSTDPTRSEPTRDVLDRRVGGGGAGFAPTEWSLAPAGDERASGPVVDPAPLVVSVFEAANDRRATALERILLAELERDADPAARAVGSTGAAWVVAALREAVASGSAFVAPKRIREIIQRWAADGDGPRDESSAGAPALAGPAGVIDVAGDPTPVTDVRLPGGGRGGRVWGAVLDDLAGVLSGDAYDLLLSESAIRRYWRGTVEITVGSALAADKLSIEYRSLVERLLNARLTKPVAVTFHVAEAAAPPTPIPSNPTAPPSAFVVSRADIDLGRQVWHAVLSDLEGMLAPGDAERLSGVVPLGQDAAGLMLLASPSPVVRRLVEDRYRVDIERALSTLLCHAVRVRVVGRDEWALADEASDARE